MQNTGHPHAESCPSSTDQVIGKIVRPDGTRLPVRSLLTDGKILVVGTYLEFETTIGAAIAYGYTLEDASPELSEAWDKAVAKRQKP